MTPEKDSPRTDCRTFDALLEATRKNTATEETKTHSQRRLPADFQPVSSILRAGASGNIFSDMFGFGLAGKRYSLKNPADGPQ